MSSSDSSASPAAVAMVARAEARRRPRALLGLTVLVALVSAVVLAGAAGTRRTATVLDRFLDGTDSADAIAGVASPAFASDPDRVRALTEDVAAVEGVARVAPYSAVPAVIGTERDVSLISGFDDRYLALSRPVVVAGRMPAPDAAREVALSEVAAAELDLVPGDHLTAETMLVQTAEAMFDGETFEFRLDGPRLELEVVGVIRDLDSLAGSFEGTSPNGMVGVMSPAFLDDTEGASTIVAGFYLVGSPDELDLAEVVRVIADAAPRDQPDASWVRQDVEPFADAVEMLAIGLAAFTAVALVAGIAAVTQAVSRHVSAGRATHAGLRMLGMSRRGVTAATALPVVAAGVAGVTAGVGLAVAASPLFPVSIARRAELDRGAHVDVPVLLAGWAVLVVAVATAAWLSARHQGSRPAEPSMPPPIGWRLRPGLPATITVALSSVARSSQRIAARSAVAGTAVGVAGVIAVAVFVASHQAAIADPARYGWSWTVQPDVYTEDALAMATSLAEEPHIDAVGGIFCDTASSGGTRFDACGLMALGGVVPIAVTEGRLPAGPAEIAFGTATMGRLGARIGDDVVVENPAGDAATYAVVGRIVAPAIDGPVPGEGAVFGREGFEAFTGAPIEQMNVGRSGTKMLVLTFSPEADQPALEGSLTERYPIEFKSYGRPSPPTLVGQVQRIRPTVIALGAFLGLLGLASLVHYVTLSARQRRKELAVLAALGFARRQVRATVSWQASLVAVAGIVLGVPLGVLAGRSAWLATVRNVGMVDTPAIPVVAGAVVVVATLVGALLVAVVPGRLATRQTPAEALRTE